MSQESDRLSILPNLYSKTGDDTTILDSSTVPTYEEFTRKKINKNLFNKVRHLNSTQYYEPSSIITDDESDGVDDIDHSPILPPTPPPPPLPKRPVSYHKQIFNPEKICSALERIQIQSHSPNINPYKSSSKLIRPPPSTPVQPQKQQQEKIQKTDSLEDEYIQLEHKEIQTSFTNYENTSLQSKDSFDLHLSKSIQNDSVDIISETICESPPPATVSETQNKNLLLKTPLRLTESQSICPKSFIKLNDDNSPKLIRLSTNRPSPNIITTYEKHKFEEKNVIIINHQTDQESKKKKSSKNRVSMCMEDLPQEIVEHNLDEDENRLDVTRGNIVTLESINENDKENRSELEDVIENSIEIRKEIVVQQRKQKSSKTLSSDSESNDEAFEKFLQQHRQKQQQQTIEVQSIKKIAKNFVVDDNYVSSATTTTTTTDTHETEETTTSSSSDEQIFYIKTTNKISSKKVVNEKPGFNNIRKKYEQVSTTSTSSSEIEDDDDEEEEEDQSESEEEEEVSFQNETPIKNHRQRMDAIPTLIKQKNNDNGFRTPQPKANHPNKFQSKTEVKKIPPKIQRFGFIESLSACIPDEQRHPEAIEYCKKFTNKKIKDELLKKVFGLFNEAVFDGKLPPDMKILWNNRLTSTAGMCKYKTEMGKPTAEIHISNKVCDTPERLRDTCVHEMCHAAVYLFNGSKNEGHGRIWQSWAHKVTDAFKNIPKVSTSHNYTINKKFVYKCLDCGQEIHRFQKSIDLEKNVCGRCHGHFVLLQNDKKQQEKQKNMINDKFIFGSEIDMLQLQNATPRKLNTFAQFVKDNYNTVKTEQKLSSHKDVMQEISKKFKQLSSK